MHGRESNSQPVDHKSDALTTTPPSHTSTLNFVILGIAVKLNIVSSPQVSANFLYTVYSFFSVTSHYLCHTVAYSVAQSWKLMASFVFAVSGFGFGVISGAFSLVNILADMTGPGTVGILGQSSQFFITSGTSFLYFLSVCSSCSTVLLQTPLG